VGNLPILLGADEGIALRGLFIIDKEGVVQHATINNLAFGRSVDEALRTLQVCNICLMLQGRAGLIWRGACP